MTNSTEMRKGTETFRPRARLISVLGEQLIRDVTVGLLELVKNGYDADADTVTVKLLNLANPTETTIIVEDNGYGMDLDTILYKWLEPATGHKEMAKEKQQRTPKGRLPLGEKGVGRFAAHKLSCHLTLISRAQNEQRGLSANEVVITIDWDKFDNPEAYLSDIVVDYEERKPQHFLKDSGTLMVMNRVRTPWKATDVYRVSRSLRRLMSPFHTPEAFNVKLICPEYPKYEELDPSELLKTAHAQMDIAVDENGIANYGYKFNLSPFSSRSVELQRVDLRSGIKNWQPIDRKSNCGEFSVTLYIWDRNPTNLRLSATNIADLNEVSGISVVSRWTPGHSLWRADDDWLSIDQSRYMYTSEAFSRKNVVGAVEISQLNNKNLRDKTNREGFIENQAFMDLHDLMKAVMNIAFNEFAEDRKRIRKAEKVAKKELVPTVIQLEAKVNSVTHALKETRKLAKDFVTQGKIAPEVAEQMLAAFNQTSQDLEVAVSETQQATTDTLTTFNQEREMLLTLTGLGLAAERFTHEFARLTREAADLLLQIKRIPQIQQLAEATNKINTLRVTLEALQDMVLALGPMFYVRHKTRVKELKVKTIVNHALLLNQGQIKDNKIQIEIDEEGELLVVMREGALTQVFNNLIDNACYWLSRKSQENDRHLKITILADEQMVIVADNGPGVQPNYRHRVFELFFLLKPMVVVLVCLLAGKLWLKQRLPLSY
ncbi:MAG: hypothetical protein HC875_30120 [Anaerolineales bacterium]|nr:hypothetical protein [Anaerolineales bacterium]